jgi:hypothetical protein
MTLLIPPVHAAVLAAVSIRHQRNTLNTHLNLLDDLSTQPCFGIKSKQVFQGRGNCHKGQKGEAGWVASSNRFPNEPKTTRDPSGRFLDSLHMHISGLSDGEQPHGGGTTGGRYRCRRGKNRHQAWNRSQRQ